MVTATPSTTVTDHPDTDPNNAPCDIADRKRYNSQMSIRICVVGSAVESSLAKRGTRVRCPDDADYIFVLAPRKNICDT